MFNTFKKCCGIVAMFALYLYSAPAAFAQCDDGSIELTFSFDYDFYPNETSWALLDANGAEILYVNDGGEFGSYTQCVPDSACYTLEVYDLWNDGGPSYTVSSAEYGLMVSGVLEEGLDQNFFCAGEVTNAGCMDDLALNWNSNATEDDGSCEYIDASCETTGSFCYGNGSVEVVGYAASPDSSLYLQFLTGGVETCCDELYVYSSFDFSPENLLYEDLNQPIPGTVISSPTGVVVIVMDSDGSVSCSSGSSQAPEISWIATCEVEGCPDPEASNYDPNATVETTCEYIGCTDSSAFNYDPTATTDDGSCELPSCSWSGEFCYGSSLDVEIMGYAVAPEGENINLLFEQGNIEDDYDQIYVYDGLDLSTANVIWSAGTSSVSGYEDFSGAFITSTTGVVVIVINSDSSVSCESSSSLNPIVWAAGCDAAVGCTDASACNYDEGTSIDDGSCLQLDECGVCGGDGIAEGACDCDGNGPEAGYDCDGNCLADADGDGVCDEFEVAGCTDAIACNYNADATDDDGSCDYSCIGCMQQNAANYDPTATQEIEGSCIFCDSGTYPLTVTMTDAGGDGWNGATYSLQAIDGSADISGSADAAQTEVGGVYTDYVCTTLGCYIFYHGGGTADGENSVTLSDQFGTDYVTGLGANEVYNLDFGLFGECGFSGCTDSGCFNYDPSATIDDGSCVCPPDNDAIANAEPVDCGMTLSADLSNASDPDGLIGLYAGYAPGVWFSFNASGTDQVDVNTCGTATSGLADAVTDTRLHIFKEQSDGSLEFVTYNDDGCGLYSSASFLTEPGENFLIHVSAGWFENGNQFELALECSDCPESPSNDYCEDAIPQLDGVTFSGTVCCTNPSSLFSGFSDHQGVWFTMNSDDPALGITFDSFYFNLTNISGESMSLSIYDGNGNCEEIFIVGACSDFTGTCAGSVSALFTLTPDTDYYFYVATPDGAGCGDFEFTTTGVHLGCMDPLADNYIDFANEDDGSCSYSIVPDNDECENAAPLACGDFFEASMGGATPDLLIPSCFPIPDGLEACTEAPSGLYPGTTSNPVCDGSTTTITTCGYAGEYSNVNVEAGTTYLFTCDPGNIATAATVDGEVIAFGLGSCAFESPVSGIIRFYESQPGNCGTTIFACTNRSVACGPDLVLPNAGGVWYTFEGTGELHNINTCGSMIDTRMALYTAPSATACADLACATDAAGNLISSTGSFETCGFFDQDDAAIEFISEVGLTYFVYVTYDYDGVLDGQGSYNLSMSCEPVVEGCTIGAACNYNPDVNVETNEVCEYTSCTCADAGNPDGVVLRIEMFDFNGGGGDGWATSDPGSTGGGYTITDQAGNVVASGSIDDALYQLDEDNFTGAEFGVDAVCVDPGCYNYSFTTATFWGEEQYWAVYEDDGTAAILSVELGEYDNTPEVTTDYGFSIGGAVCGCTDTGACNYDDLATDEDGSCEYLTCAGCTDEASCSYDAEALILDLAACCYDNCVTVTLTSGASAVVTISDLDGNALESISLSSDDASYTGCIASDCYIVSSEGDGNWTMSGIFGLAISGGTGFEPTYFSVGGSNCVFGCNVLAACNYDATVNILDISTCSFDDCAGCTYEIASNYYPLDDDGNPITVGFVAPSVDDGSCEFDLSNPCPADINEDGSVTTADLLVFLGAFGSVCE